MYTAKHIVTVFLLIRRINNKTFFSDSEIELSNKLTETGIEMILKIIIQVMQVASFLV